MGPAMDEKVKSRVAGESDGKRGDMGSCHGGLYGRRGMMSAASGVLRRER